MATTEPAEEALQGAKCRDKEESVQEASPSQQEPAHKRATRERAGAAAADEARADAAGKVKVEVAAGEPQADGAAAVAGWGAVTAQGSREHQEDRFVGDAEAGVFAVFDGHGGSLASTVAKRSLLRHWKAVRAEEGFDLRAAWPKVPASVFCTCFSRTQKKR